LRYSGYNFTIASSVPGATWGEITIEIETSSGARIGTSGGGWNVSVWSDPGILIAAYDLQSATPTWTQGGSETTFAGESILLTSPRSTPLSGDVLYIFLGGDFRGTTTVTIP
jgi:hypothetical protein